MQAKDVMTTTVATVTPETPVHEIAALLLERHIGAVPVVDSAGQVLGIVSEGDLLHRPEVSGKRRRSWWLAWLSDSETRVTEYVKTHGTHAAEVMSRPAVTVPDDMPIDRIARLLDERRIKRVPVLREGRLVGIVSRADLLRGLVVHPAMPQAQPLVDDQVLRQTLLDTLHREALPDNYINVIVVNGIVHFWGLIHSEQERQALHIAAMNTPGVKGVEDHLGQLQPGTLAD